MSGRQGKWQRLSESYRQRLLSSGINQEAYESGASLQAARGHGTTPERESRTNDEPDRWRGYLARANRKRGPIRVITTRGVVQINDASPAERSLIGRHANAARNYLNGDRNNMADFEGVTVRGMELETWGGSLEDMAATGELDYGDTIYVRN